MGEILSALMRWVHLLSVLTLLGGIFYARFVMTPAAQSLPPDARAALDKGAAARFRPLVFAAMTGLVLSGIFNYLAKPGHSIRYSSLFGMKMLLVLHVFSVAILVAAPQNPRRARQMLGAAISGVAILLISAYLKGIA